MPRRVLDVFLSSTAKDLAAHREAVHERLMRTGLFHCVRQEDFGAQDAGAVDYCRQAAQKADLFVGLVGLRRGWEPDGDNAKRSITEMEHDWAREAGRRRYLWVAPDDFHVRGDLRESDAQHIRQVVFRSRVMGAGERIVSQKGFGSPDLLASEIVEHLLAQVVTSDLIKELRPELVRQDAEPAEAQAPAIAAAVGKLADDKDVDLLALAKDPKGVDLAELEAKLEARAGEHEAAGERERKASAEYWRHIGALASLRSIRKARDAYAKAAAFDPGDVAALLRGGWLAMQAGDLAASEQTFQRVLELKEDLPLDRAGYWARLGLGDIAKARGSLGQALAAYRAVAEEAERLAKADPDNTEWQRDLSVSHNRIGNVFVAQGKLADALAAFQASLSIRERLAEADADNTQWQRDLCVSHFKIGGVFVDRGRLADALTAFQASRAIAERLAEADADNTDWQRDLSVSHNRIGDVLVAQGKLADAFAAFQASLSIRERLAKADVDNTQWQRDLSNSHERIGNVLVAQGKLADALAAFQASLSVREPLAKADTDNTQWQRDLAISHDRIGDVLVAQGKLAEALAAFQPALAIAERLVKADPDNTQWQRDLSISHDRIGNVLVAQGKLAEALAAFQASLTIRERLAKADGDNTQWQRDLSVSHERIGDVLAAQGKLPDALAAYHASLPIAERLAKADVANTGWQADLAAGYGKLGQLLAKMSRTQEALSALRTGRTIVAPLVASAPDHVLWKGYLSSFDADIAKVGG